MSRSDEPFSGNGNIITTWYSQIHLSLHSWILPFLAISMNSSSIIHTSALPRPYKHPQPLPHPRVGQLCHARRLYLPFWHPIARMTSEQVSTALNGLKRARCSRDCLLKPQTVKHIPPHPRTAPKKPGIISCSSKVLIPSVVFLIDRSLEH